MRHTVFAALLIVAFPHSALACLRTPHNVTFAKTTFSPAFVKIEPSANCGAKIKITTQGKEYVLLNRDDKLCVQQSADSCDSSANTVPIYNGKTTAGILQFANGKAWIFSVGEDKDKDLNKPFMRFSAHDKNSILLEAVEKGYVVGKLTVNKSQYCTRPIREDRSGELRLQGREYIGEGSGCEGSFDGLTFEAKKDDVGGPEKTIAK